MALVTLQQPYKTFRGRNAIASGQVTFPVRQKSIARVWVAPFQPRTDLQVEVRAALSQASTAWGALTQNQVNAWNAYAASLRPRHTKDLVPYPITGKQAYMEINVFNIYDGDPLVSVPPTNLTSTVITGITSITDVAGDIQVIFTTDGATGNVYVELSGTGITPARRARPNDIRSIGSPIINSLDTTTTSPHTFACVQANLRIPWTSGDTVACRITPFSSEWVRGAAFTSQPITIA